MAVKLFLRSPFLLSALIASSCFISIVVKAEPADIGDRLELFLDKTLIESADGVEFRLHHPVKVPRPESPLPERHYITVIKDEELLRAYWRDSSDLDEGGPRVRFAESSDGHEWTFPSLGLHEVDGSDQNNVILANEPDLLHNFVPFLDARPEVEKDKRYKALAGHPGPGDKRKMDVTGLGLYAFYSGDGIHWKKGKEVIPYQPEWRHAFDSANVSFWSEAEQCYVCYFRTWTQPERLRSVSRTTSKDFETWSKPVAMDPNLPGEHLYTTQTHPYFRAPHFYIALPTRYVQGRGTAAEGTEEKANATDILLMSSRSGSERFDRLFKEAFMRPGLDAARWINRANYVALNVIPTGPNEMSIYHRSGDRYTLRTDGFVSIHAGAKEGGFLTRPIRFSGDTLALNLSTSAVGEVRVGVLDSEGNEFPGFGVDECLPVFGDAIDLKLKWKDNPSLTKIQSQAVQLRFVMKECDLYSYHFGKPLVE